MQLLMCLFCSIASYIWREHSGKERYHLGMTEYVQVNSPAVGLSTKYQLAISKMLAALCTDDASCTSCGHSIYRTAESVLLPVFSVGLMLHETVLLVRKSLIMISTCAVVGSLLIRYVNNPFSCRVTTRMDLSTGSS